MLVRVAVQDRVRDEFLGVLPRHEAPVFFELETLVENQTGDAESELLESAPIAHRILHPPRFRAEVDPERRNEATDFGLKGGEAIVDMIGKPATG